MCGLGLFFLCLVYIAGNASPMKKTRSSSRVPWGKIMNKDVKDQATIPLEQLTYCNFVLIDALGELLCEKGLITLGEWRDRAKKIRDEKRDETRLGPQPGERN